ncbi:MAG: phospholipase C type enzyme [Peltula sp. TS41687]|nr:MAG: phospholipase C type enzyme [Peltula sp. TS41687]
MEPHHPQSSSVPTKIKVISLNCWGLKYLSKHRHARLAEIGARLASRTPAPQIVGLQECWTQEDYQTIRRQTQHILPYGKFYYGGIFGAGLAILSAWPIEESSMIGYPLNGRPTAFFRGDWFVGKGVACARIRLGDGPKDVLEVFCTHLHAPYEREPNDSYKCHRTAQAWMISKLMRGAAERGHLVIGLGDFNMVPFSLAHRLITTHAPVVDAWLAVHPNSSDGLETNTADNRVDEAPTRDNTERRMVPFLAYNLTQNGTTCDSALNTWRWDKARQRQLDKGNKIHVPDGAPDPSAKRLDYIFVGGTSSSTWECQVEDVRVGMTEPHPSLNCSLSDHFSVEATLSMKLSRDGGFEVGKMTFLPRSTYDAILALIDKYTARERRQRRFRLAHFSVQTLVTLGCLVSIWWMPYNFISFVFLLLSSLGFGAGVVDGLIGGLFVSSELRSLKEFEWEMRNLRERAMICNADADDEYKA